MSVPVVAIIGRPNVGKSSLFNWLARKRIAIVDPTAGVTRDRLATLIKADERFFELTDTGGFGIQDVDNLTEDIERQIDAAIDQASVVLFVVDAREGLMPLDEEVAKKLRYVTKPVMCVANKCDTDEVEEQTGEFYKLGRGKLICVSSHQNRNRQELLDMIVERLPPPEKEDDAEKTVALKIAIVGRRNTGKSTFINCLAESERIIVSEIPGTTRDSVDVRLERDGQTFIAIDTAGIRRKSSLGSDIEFHSLHRAERSIRRADVVLMFQDAAAPISKVDKQISDYVLEQHKPAIFVINKWDLMKPTPTGKYGQYLRATFPSLDFTPIAFITATKSKNVQAVLNLAQNIHKQAVQRVGTGDLNREVRAAVEAHPPPMRQNRQGKVYFATQVAVAPPTIVLFTNGPELLDISYQRYLINSFRDHLPFREVPIKLHLRHKRKNEQLQPDREKQDAIESEVKALPRQKKKKTADLSKLEFKTDVSEEELDREAKHYESELWRDL